DTREPTRRDLLHNARLPVRPCKSGRSPTTDEDMEVSHMVSVSSLLDFLLSLLQDDEAKEEFERDPQGMLARNGLEGVRGQDVRDVAPMMADHPAVYPSGGGSSSYGDGGHAPRHYHEADEHDDPVREINYLKQNYDVDRTVINNEYNLNYYDDRTYIDIDDRDYVNIEAEGDVTINDSFNSDNSVTIIEDSFNEDNDGVDNKGGVINDSTVAGDDMVESGNTDESTTVSDSYNDSSTNDSANDTSTTVSDSGNDDSTTVSDSANDSSVSVVESGNSDDDLIEADLVDA
ncbi:MAG: MSCRAMM family adhesin SdrC, partial [Actinobacteria bacterium]|nr:MSCRAMM family adhesin SdrC [Actinomycetota bacterium]